ncbi:hypothetical protein UFOVP703_27 [uncultured Caudovirales phage]|uniref:Uncharacterized protein n=1 Tax=uncultured Caudovirales phage TaxID=2100421 RepID=A0A6J5NIA8_9CAUD|nr:hypothetical protein UFOVP703_27 [uncultured Caudovirales phage]
MATFAEMVAWARKAKESGEILDFEAADGGLSTLTDQGWSPAMYGSDTEPERINGCDPRDECDAGFLTWRTT